MKFSKTVSAIALAFCIYILPGQAASDPVKTAGVVCWTGEIEYLSTSEQDIAWVWTVNWNYMPDDRNMKNASTGRCLGSGGMIEGKPDVANEFCIHNRRDDAKFMSQGQSSPKGSKAVMFGGTGSFAGVVGGWNGGERIDLPTGDGKLAGCRATSGEYTLK